MCPNPLRFWRPPARGCESRPRCHRTPIRIAGACSPSPPHRLAAAPQDARTSAVSSRVTADAWSARGLSFADFQAGGGAFAPPEWPCSPGSLHPFLQGKRRACSPRTIARLRLRRQPRRWWVDQFSRVARGVTEGARFGETPRFWSGGNTRAQLCTRGRSNGPHVTRSSVRQRLRCVIQGVEVSYWRRRTRPAETLDVVGKFKRRTWSEFLL